MVTQLLPEIGHFALILGACLALVQAVVPLAGGAPRRPLWMSFAPPMAWGQFLFVPIGNGRGAGWERGEISGGAGSLKKKNK